MKKKSFFNNGDMEEWNEIGDTKEWNEIDDTDYDDDVLAEYDDIDDVEDMDDLDGY